MKKCYLTRPLVLITTIIVCGMGATAMMSLGGAQTSPSGVSPSVLLNLEAAITGAQVPAKAAANLRAKLDEAMRCVDVWSGASPDEDLRSEITSFVKLNAAAVGPDGSFLGHRDYWIAFVLSDAVSRPRFSNDSLAKLTQSNANCIAAIRAKIQEGLLGKMSENQKKEFEPAIAKYCDKFVGEVGSASEDLRKDRLFPVFKNPITKGTQQRIISYFSDPKIYPVYSEPTSVMESAEEAYDRRLDVFFHECTDDCVYYMTIEQLLPLLVETKAWGHMQVNISNSEPGSAWPVNVDMSPDERVNSELHWQKK